MGNIHSIFGKVSPFFRRKRMSLFFSLLKPDDRTKLLDLGGLPSSWVGQPGHFPVVLINLLPHPANNPRFTTVKANVLAVPFANQAFDLVFSNSVIEHLGTWENQKIFAGEVKRMAPKYWVQTPARSFPIEPHLISPFVHYLPKALQRHLIRWFTVWGWLHKPSRPDIDAFLEEVRLLNHQEMQSLFPDGRILRERFFGITKSYIAVKN